MKYTIEMFGKALKKIDSFFARLIERPEENAEKNGFPFEVSPKDLGTIDEHDPEYEPELK